MNQSKDIFSSAREQGSLQTNSFVEKKKKKKKKKKKVNGKRIDRADCDRDRDRQKRGKQKREHTQLPPVQMVVLAAGQRASTWSTSMQVAERLASPSHQAQPYLVVQLVQ
jgi:hypothetical protein